MIGGKPITRRCLKKDTRFLIVMAAVCKKKAVDKFLGKEVKMPKMR